MIRALLLSILFVNSVLAKPKVVATTTFLADITQNIAGDFADVKSLLPFGADPHIYDPVPADARLISQAQLIISNGLTLEGWIDKLLVNAPKSAVIIVASTGVKAIGNAAFHNAFDPHAWMDLNNARIYVRNISNALQALIPEHNIEIENQTKAYLLKIDEAENEVFQVLSKIKPEHRVIITSHDAFRYFGNRYGFEVESVIGTSTDAEVRLEDINRLIAIIHQKKIPAIFIESTINPKLLESLSRDLKIRIGGKLFADSLGPKGSKATTYLAMIVYDAKTLANALIDEREAESATTFPVFIIVLAILFVILFFVLGSLLKGTKSVTHKAAKTQIEIKGLTVSYDSSPVLTNCYLTIDSGFVYGLIGQNGSGKSTLMKAILGLIKPDAGTVLINKHDVNNYRKWIAYVPQKEDVDWQFPATVFDVILLGRFPHLGVFEKPGKADFDMVQKVMDELEISHLSQNHISELSGGQQQRVFIARSLCQEAEIYLFDEPFVGIDIATEEKIIKIIKKMAADGKTVVIIHHDLTKVNEYFDRLILVNRRVIDFGDVEKVFTKENIRETFSGSISFFAEAQSFGK